MEAVELGAGRAPRIEAKKRVDIRQPIVLMCGSSPGRVAAEIENTDSLSMSGAVKRPHLRNPRANAELTDKTTKEEELADFVSQHSIRSGCEVEERGLLGSACDNGATIPHPHRTRRRGRRRRHHH